MGQGQIPGGTTPAQSRPIQSIVEGVVAVTDAETTLFAGDVTVRNVIIQNNGPDPVQIFVTTGTAYGAGGIILSPGTATTAGGIWEALQLAGVWQGVIFGICDAGNTASVSVTEEY